MILSAEKNRLASNWLNRFFYLNPSRYLVMEDFWPAIRKRKIDIRAFQDRLRREEAYTAKK